MNGAQGTQQRFSAALDALVGQIQNDRSILAAILCGSLSHDVVWEKSDIDLLLPATAYEAVESAMLAHGFKLGRPLRSELHHHGIPLHDIDRNTFVELHTSLLPPSSELLEGNLFSLENVFSQSVDSELSGRRVRRLSAGLQLLYVCCAWNFDLTVLKFHPTFVPAIFDVAFLLRADGHKLDWHTLFSAADTDMAAGSILVMLSLLERIHVTREIPQLGALAARQRWISPLQLRAIHWALERYLLGGRSWTAPLPPPVVGRYSARRQFEKRIRYRIRPRRQRTV